MGLQDPCLQESDDDLIRAALSSRHPFLEGITLERLERERSVRLNIPSPFLPFADGPVQPGTSFNLAPPELDYLPPVESRLGDPVLLARYPLEMVSSKNDDAMNSTFSNRPENISAQSTVFMHSSDAATRGIGTGDRVRVFNDRAAMLVTALVDGVVRPGVVRIPGVSSPKMMPAGTGVNALTSPRLTDRGGGPTFYSCLVQVEKCGD